MERHIQNLLNRLSCASVTIATFTIALLLLHTPDTCVPPYTEPKPHQKFPATTCDFTHRSLTSLDKKNHRLWSSKPWLTTVKSFTALFTDLRSLTNLTNHSMVLCVSAGIGQQVMALHQIGVGDVTGVELMDAPPLVSRADPHNLPFFDDVFDWGFSAHFDEALFPTRFAAEMERTVRVGGFCVLAVEECGDGEVREVVKLFPKSRVVSVENVTLDGLEMTQIILRRRLPLVEMSRERRPIKATPLTQVPASSKKIGAKRKAAPSSKKTGAKRKTAPSSETQEEAEDNALAPPKKTRIMNKGKGKEKAGKTPTTTKKARHDLGP